MKKALTIAALYALPVAAMAQTFDAGGQGGGYIQSIVAFLSGVVVPFIIAAAIVIFIIGVFWYFILGGSDEGKKEKGKSLMIWGLLGFVLILIIQGLVLLLARTTGLSGGVIPGTQTLPTVTPSGGGAGDGE